MTAPLLLFGYGNPGRGDDALGPLLVETVEAMHLAGVECQSDMQLQVEHVTDLAGRQIILFADADMACGEPYQLTRLTAEKDGSYTSHAMTPEALLYAYRQVYGHEAPPAYLLRIRGHTFGLGEALTDVAAINLNAAIELVRKLCGNPSPERWQPHLARAEACRRPPACSAAPLSAEIERSKSPDLPPYSPKWRKGLKVT